MPEERLKEVISKWPGIGLKNVNDRLKLFYDKDHGLRISTSVDSGTNVSFQIQKEVM